MLRWCHELLRWYRRLLRWYRRLIRCDSIGPFLQRLFEQLGQLIPEVFCQTTRSADA